MQETINAAKKVAQTDILSRMRKMMPTQINKLSGNTKVTDFAVYWLKERALNIKESTRIFYQKMLNTHIFRVFGNMKLKEITSEDVQLFVMSLSEGVDLAKPLSAKTIRNVHGTLHKLLQTAYEMKLIDDNPAKHTTMPKIPKAEIIPLNNQQLNQFLNAIRGNPLEVLLKLAVFTGMRKGELMGLTWNGINFEAGCIRVYQQLSYNTQKHHYYFETPKNGKERTIYPPAAVMDMMKRYQMAGHSGKFVFQGARGGEHLTLSQIRKRFDRLVYELDLPDFRFHDLRHTYAVISIKAGVDLKTLSAFMGHHSVAFTLDRYAFALDDMKIENARKMQNFMTEQNYLL